VSAPDGAAAGGERHRTGLLPGGRRRDDVGDGDVDGGSPIWRREETAGGGGGSSIQNPKFAIIYGGHLLPGLNLNRD
jgi:hypothetical protein